MAGTRKDSDSKDPLKPEIKEPEKKESKAKPFASKNERGQRSTLIRLIAI